MKNTQCLEVGGLYPGAIPQTDICQFDMTDSGAVMTVFYSAPNSKEIQNFKTGAVKIALTVRSGIIFLLIKFGDMAWMDMPYTVHLSPRLTSLQALESTQGYGLTVVLVDRATGTIKALRLLGLPNRFSNEFRKLAVEQQSQDFSPVSYDRALNSVYNNYSTADLLKTALVTQKVTQ